MTVQKAGELWKYNNGQIKRLRKMLSEMPERYPRVLGHICIPEDSPKIFVPDYRSKKNKGYAYRYILDAIGTHSLLYPETIGINDEDLQACLEELLDNHEIRRKRANTTTWNTTDFIVCRKRVWVAKSAHEKRKYVADLLKAFRPFNLS